MLTTRAWMPCGRQLIARGHGDRHFRAGADQDHVGLAAFGIGQHVGAALQPVTRRAPGAGQRRQVLAAEQQANRPIAMGQGVAPGRGRLVGIAGPDDDQVRDGPQRRPGARPARCVGPSSPTPTLSCVQTKIVGQLHERGQACGRPHVIGENREGAAVREDAAVQRQAVEHRAHGVLADAKADVAAGEIARLDIHGALWRVLFEGVRSAEPPIRVGMRGAMASSTLPEAARVAIFAPGCQTGSAASQPGGQLAGPCLAEARGQFGVFLRRRPPASGSTAPGTPARPPARSR